MALAHSSVKQTPRKLEEMGKKDFKIAQLRAQLQKASATMHGTDWADAERYVRFRGGKYVSVDKPAVSMLPQWFLTTFESYANENESNDLWIWGLNFIETTLNEGLLPFRSLLRKICGEAILGHSDALVRQTAAHLIKKMVMLHPPNTDAKVQLYSSMFMTTGATLDPADAWHFFSGLLETLNKSKSKFNGSFLMLETLLFSLEAEFSFWIEKCAKTGKLFVPWPTICRIVWPHQVGVTNANIKFIFKLFGENLTKKGLLLKVLRNLIGLLTQIVDFCAKVHDKSELRNDIASCLAAQCTGLDPSALWTQLYLLKPDWFSALVSHKLFETLNGKTAAFGLRQFQEDLLPIDQLSKCKTQKPAVVKKDLQVVLTPLKLFPKQVQRTNKVVNKYGETSLHVNCRKGDVKVVRELLNCPMINVNVMDHNQWTPLHEACSHGQTECVELLLNHKSKSIQTYFGGRSCKGVDLFALGGDDKITALHDAVQCGHFAIVSLILDALIASDKKSGQNSLRKMLEMRSVVGQNVFDVATGDMKHLIISKMNQNVSLPTNPAKYLALSAIYIYKYTSCFKLHVIKEVMKNGCNSKLERRFADRRDLHVFNNSLSTFPIPRCSVTEAQDIRTFWMKSKKELCANQALTLMELYEKC